MVVPYEFRHFACQIELWLHVAAGVSTSRRADAQHVPSLQQESAAVSHSFTHQILHSMCGLRYKYWLYIRFHRNGLWKYW